MELRLLIVLSAAVCVLAAPAAQTYTTRFEGEEHPLSEGGKWQNAGRDWTSVRTSHGLAFGTQTGTNTNFGFASFTASGRVGANAANVPAASAPPTHAWRDGVWRRDFAQGIALVNPTRQPVTVALEPGFRRLPGKQDPAINDGAPALSVTLQAKDGIILRRP
jgi:hypothetical protein